MDSTLAGDEHRNLEQLSEHNKQIRNMMEHELHKLQVEEEMLLRKFYEATTGGVQFMGKGTNNDAMTGDHDVQTESTGKGQ